MFIHDTIEKYNMVNSGDRIVCGVSGGADSVAMLRALLILKEKISFEVCVAHLNHMLRGEESERDAEFVKKICIELDVEFYSEKIDINELAEKKGESIELAARNARYSFFDRVMSSWNGNKIATAHNADDNLETVIMHLIRGSSLNGLGGIPPIRGKVIRPLIETPRLQILEFLASIGQSYVEDSTNSQRLYTRNKIRLDILPILNSINPKASEAVVKNSMLLRQDEAYLNTLADEVVKNEMIKNHNNTISVFVLRNLSPSLQRRVILQMARETVKFANYYLEFEHICDIIKLAYADNPSAKLNMPDGLIVARRYDELIFFTADNRINCGETKIVCDENIKFGDYEISCRRVEKEICSSCKTGFAIPERVINSLVVRPRKIGDSIKLQGRPEKTLKKLFIDEKIPKEERGKIPVLAVNDKVVAVYGFGADISLSASDKEKIFWVEIRRTRI